MNEKGVEGITNFLVAASLTIGGCTPRQTNKDPESFPPSVKAQELVQTPEIQEERITPTPTETPFNAPISTIEKEKEFDDSVQVLRLGINRLVLGQQEELGHNGIGPVQFFQDYAEILLKMPACLGFAYQLQEPAYRGKGVPDLMTDAGRSLSDQVEPIKAGQMLLQQFLFGGILKDRKPAWLTVHVDDLG